MFLKGNVNNMLCIDGGHSQHQFGANLVGFHTTDFTGYKLFIFFSVTSTSSVMNDVIPEILIYISTLCRKKWNLLLVYNSICTKWLNIIEILVSSVCCTYYMVEMAQMIYFPTFPLSCTKSLNDLSHIHGNICFVLS